MYPMIVFNEKKEKRKNSVLVRAAMLLSQKEKLGVLHGINEDVEKTSVKMRSISSGIKFR